MRRDRIEDFYYLLTGSRNQINRILFLVVVVFLLFPILYFSTTSVQGDSLVEIRSILSSAEEFPESKTQEFILDFFALSQIDARFAVPLFENILLIIYSNHFQNISISYDFAEISKNAEQTKIYSFDQIGSALLYKIHPIGFEELYLFSLSIRIQFPTDYFFQGYESYTFLADHFLMVPRVTTLFSREIGFKYTETVYSGPNWGGNPSVPLIPQNENVTDSIRYAKFLGNLVILYIMVLFYRGYKLHKIKMRMRSDSEPLYPHKN